MKIEFLNSLDELLNYDKIYITDTIDKIEKKKDKSIKTLVLIYPNIPVSNKKFKNLKLRNLPLSILNKNYKFKWKSHKQSVEFTDNNFNKITIINKVVIKILQIILNKKKKDLFLKNHIAKKFEKYFFLINIREYFLKFNKNIELKNSDPELQEVFIYTKKNNLPSNVSITFQYNNLKFMYETIKNFFVILLYPFYAILKSKQKIFSSSNNNIKICIRQNNSNLGVNNFPKISDDWILDNKDFKSENTLFVLEDQISDEKIKILKKKNYNFINANLKKPLEIINLKILLIVVLKFIPIFLISSIIYLFINRTSKKLFFDLLVNFFIWDLFTINYKNIKYITYHNFQNSHLVRNYFLNRSGSKSFTYKHTFSENVFDKNLEEYCNVNLSYACHDYEFHMSNIGLDMSYSNKSASKKKFISGPVWSSKIFEKDKYVLRNSRFQISAFNTSFSPHGVNGFVEHYNFLKFLKVIIETYDVDVNFKGKYDYELFNENKLTKDIFKELLENKNFNLIERYTSPRALINSTELCISMSFATPGFEALYTKNKSFFVDMGSNYENSLVDTCTQNFVSHGFENSLKLFNIYYNQKEYVNKLINSNYKSIFKNVMDNDPVNFIKKSIHES